MARTVFLSLLPAIVSGCIVIKVQEGNGVPATEEREVGEFSGVMNTTGFDVHVLLGAEASVAVTCDENLIDEVETRVESGVLVVSEAEHGLDTWTIFPHADCFVQVVTPDLESLTATGGGDLDLVGDGPVSLRAVEATGGGDLLVDASIVTDELDGLASGGGDLLLGVVQADAVHLIGSGGGDISAGQGATERLEVLASGGGSVLVRPLVGQHVEVTISGGGDVEVTATESLDARLSGSGDLTWWGDPATRDVQATGSGEAHPGD